MTSASSAYNSPLRALRDLRVQPIPRASPPLCAQNGRRARTLPKISTFFTILSLTSTYTQASTRLPTAPVRTNRAPARVYGGHASSPPPQRPEGPTNAHDHTNPATSHTHSPPPGLRGGVVRRRRNGGGLCASLRPAERWPDKVGSEGCLRPAITRSPRDHCPAIFPEAGRLWAGINGGIWCAWALGGCVGSRGRANCSVIRLRFR